MSLETLNIARHKLTDSLGEKAHIYFNNMKLWFKMKITKEEFDSETRNLLNSEQIHLHNQFFLCLLNKVEGLAEATLSSQEKLSSQNKNSRRHKRSSKSSSEKCNYDPADLIDYLPPNSPPGAGSEGVKYAAQEHFLPDHSLIVGRFMLIAWELGLEGAHDEAADMIVVSLQNFLKNILSAVLTQRKGYKLCNSNFVYDLNSDVPNMWLRNTGNIYDPRYNGRTTIDENAETPIPKCPPTINEVEQAKAFEIACRANKATKVDTEPFLTVLFLFFSSQQSLTNNDKVTINEMYTTLQTNRNIIPSHSIYAVNMERLATMLSHPSY